MLLAAGSALLGLLLLEVGMRAAGFRPALPPEGRAERLDRYFGVADRRLGYRNRGNGRYRNERIAARPLVTTDSLGFRNGLGWNDGRAGPLVAFVGDSTTFCAEVEDRETGPSEVAALLGAEFDLRVLNAGVRGFGALQAKRMLEGCLERFPRLAAAVYVHCGNDLAETLDPTAHFPVLAPSAWWSASEKRLLEIEFERPIVPWETPLLDFAPPEGGWTTAATFAAVSGQVEELSPFDREAFLAALEELRPIKEARARPPARKRLDARLRDWLRGRSALVHALHSIGSARLVSDAAEPGESPEARWARGHGAAEALPAILRAMDAACRARGAALLVTGFTRSARPDPFLEEACRAAGVRHAPIHEAFPGDPEAYAAAISRLERDPHYGPVGTKAFARGIAPALREALGSR